MTAMAFDSAAPLRRRNQMVRTSAVQETQKPRASMGGAAVQRMLRRAKRKYAVIQRKVVVRKLRVGREGLPPVEKNAAVRRSMRVRVVDTAVPRENSSWKNRTARQERKEKRKPMSPGRTRKSLWVLLGVEDEGCWSVVFTEADGIADLDVFRCRSLAGRLWRCCEFIA
jgi:hypothetical protein